MQLTTAYIISWFGRDDVKQKRQQYHSHQLDWCSQHGLQAHVLAQEYSDSDYAATAVYTKNIGALMFPGTARNQLLEQFYNSDQDYAVFADNDSILHSGVQHCDSRNFIELFRTISLEKLGSVDALFPINPANQPFNKTYQENPTLFADNLVFRRSTAFKGSWFILKNLKKFYGQELYYDQASFTDSQGKMIGGEDVDFGLQMLKNNLGVYQCQNIILKELGHTVSTWTQGARGHGAPEVKDAGKNVLLKKYNLTTNKAGHIQFRDVYKNNPNPAKLIVAKKQHIDNLFELC